MSTDVVIPAVRDAEMLTANLAVRLLLAPGAGHKPVKCFVYSALKFDPLLYRIRFFAVSPSLLGLSSYTAAWIICTCIIRFTFKPLIDIDFSMTLRSFT